jgi:hypothetical protein
VSFPAFWLSNPEQLTTSISIDCVAVVRVPNNSDDQDAPRLTFRAELELR